MASADTDRNKLQREIGALTAGVARRRRRFVDTGSALAFIGADSAVILFVVVQLVGFDEPSTSRTRLQAHATLN